MASGLADVIGPDAKRTGSGASEGKQAQSKGKGKGKRKGGKAKSADVYSPPAADAHMVFYMSWQRRHKHRPEEQFFGMLRAAGGFRITHNGDRVYEITRELC